MAYFSELRGFLSGQRRRMMPRRGAGRSSPFVVESLEARVLLSADLAAAIPVADILESSTFGMQPAATVSSQSVLSQAEVLWGRIGTFFTPPAQHAGEFGG